MTTCAQTPAGRRRLYWTHADCGEMSSCGVTCAQFGFTAGQGQPSGIEWVRGLAINILMTHGQRPESTCGVRPGNRGGHWSEAFVPNNDGFGSLLHTAQASRSVRDSLNEIRAYAIAAMNKLVSYGVADSVNTTVEYLGGAKVSLRVEIFGRNGDRSNVAIAGERASNAWIWS